jgi:hypothetical protein
MISTQLFTGQKRDKRSNTVDVDKYKQLLLRAQELTKKYKTLTGSDNLPTDLHLSAIQSGVDLENLPKEVVPGVIKTAGLPNVAEGTSRNVVIGMAQDTDSKNLVLTSVYNHQHSSFVLKFDLL